MIIQIAPNVAKVQKLDRPRRQAFLNANSNFVEASSSSDDSFGSVTSRDNPSAGHDISNDSNATIVSNMAGDDDNVSVASGGATAAAAQVVRNYDETNSTDKEGFNAKPIRVAYDPNDILFWFDSLENAMEWAGVGSQWTKRQVLHQNLPSDAIEEVKGLFRLKQNQARNLPYKTIKDELISLFGPNDEEAYAKAAQLVLVGKPSQLAKKLVDHICVADVKLAGCCCARTIAGMWRAER